MQTTIIINRTRISSLDDLRANFNSAEFLAYLKSGRMIKWLNERGESNLAEKISTINAEDKSSVKVIMKILSIAEDKCPVQEEPKSTEEKVGKSDASISSAAYMRIAETQEEREIAEGRDNLLKSLASRLNTNINIDSAFNEFDVPADAWNEIIENVMQDAGLSDKYIQAKENLKNLEFASAQKKGVFLYAHTWSKEHAVTFSPMGMFLGRKRGKKIVTGKIKVSDLAELCRRRKMKYCGDPLDNPFTVADLTKVLYCGPKQLIPTLKRWDELHLDLILQRQESDSSCKDDDKKNLCIEEEYPEISFEEAEKTVASSFSIVPITKTGISEDSALLSEWLVKEGDSVKKDDSLFTIETGKCCFDATSPRSGVVQKIFVLAGEDVATGTPACIIASRKLFSEIPAHLLFTLGKGFIELKKQPSIGLFFIELAANHNDADAQYMLSRFFCPFGGGKDIPHEITEEIEKKYSSYDQLKEGEKWLQKAVENGNADAQFDSGLVKCFGEPDEYDEGIKLIKLAAEQNHKEALLCMEDPEAYFLKLDQESNGASK